jgi:hypothetical protein
MNRIPIFSPFSEMVKFDKPLYMKKENAYKLSDFTIYKVHTEKLGEDDIARYLIFDKKIVLYYGKYLKEVITMLPGVTFKITASAEPYMTRTIDWSVDLKRLYANKNLNNDQKKLIPNTLLGCADKFQSHDITADCFFSRSEANNVYSANEGISRVRVRSNLADVTWEKCREQVEEALLEEMGQHDDCHDEQDHDCRDEFGIQVSSKYELAKWERINNVYQSKKPTLHLNIQRNRTSTFDQGFLAISLMKYNHNRLSILKMWLRIIDSGTLLPIAVKTDNIFVAESTFVNYRWLSKRMSLPPNSDFDKITEQEQKEGQDRVEAVAKKAHSQHVVDDDVDDDVNDDDDDDDDDADDDDNDEDDDVDYKYG